MELYQSPQSYRGGTTTTRKICWKREEMTVSKIVGNMWLNDSSLTGICIGELCGLPNSWGRVWQSPRLGLQ